jgi:fucose permease
MMSVLMLGITASCFDVGINSVATEVERASGKSLLSKLHAFGCAGGLAGATLGSVFASFHIPPSIHFVVVALPLMLVLWLGYEMLNGGHAPKAVEKKVFCLPKGPLALLGALGFFGSIAEGSIADWSGVYLKDHFGVADGFAPLALTSFSIMMLITRLIGDRLKTYQHARWLVSRGASAAALGIAIAVFAPNQYCALSGFAITGLGLALVFPFVFSAAGKEGPTALAGVATMAYSGSLVGPPLIGMLAHGLGMQAAIGFIGVLSVTIALVASRTDMLK